MINRLIILSVLFGLITSCKAKVNSDTKNKSATFYLIRHAEKDRSDPDEQNPNLTKDIKQISAYDDTSFLAAL